jgi:heat-inducible transcriptional repressor
MPGSLGERQATILRAVVAEYVATGEPVGSRHVTGRPGLNISSATVRNEMARLEELGYLVQPHTSAGRVPTDLGYRFVVDQLKPRSLSEGQRRQIASELGGEDMPTLDDLLHRASDVVSRFTHHAAAILSRRFRPSRLRRVELVAMGSRTALAVLIADNGRVEQRMIQLDEALGAEDLDALVERINKDVSGKDLEESVKTLRGAGGAGSEHAVREGVAAGLETLRESEDHVIFGGVANLAGEETFERDQLQRLYDALERQTEVLEMLSSAMDAPPLTVRIGSELASADFRDCSLVVANFGLGAAALGSVGVIGPIRMDYARVIATANTVARLLEAQLSASDPA